MALLSSLRNKSTRYERTNYPYATARVRAKKAKLLPRETYLKMLKMSIPEITQTISETGYQEQVDTLAARFSGIDLVESALNVNEEQTYAQIRGFVTGEAQALVEAFLDRYNYRDIKVILRGKQYGASQEEMFKELLIEDREEFEFLRGLMADTVEGISGVISALADATGPNRRFYEALKTAELLHPEPGLSHYEDALDRFYYANLLDQLELRMSSAKQLFLRFVKREIDAANLIAVLRYRKAKLEWTNVEPLVMPGGFEMDLTRLRRIFEAASTEDVQNELHQTRFGEALDEALARNDLARAEIAIQKQLMEFASGFSHMHPLSILPIIDFLLRKHTEVRNLRAVARGREAGLPEETIQDMLII